MGRCAFNQSTETATSGTRTLAVVMGGTSDAGDALLELPERSSVASPAVFE